METFEAQVAELEAAVETILYLRATRPSGFDWEAHRDGFAELIDLDDETGRSAHDAARAALVDFAWPV